MIAFDGQADSQRRSMSDNESEDGEEGDYTVYECPGLAPVIYQESLILKLLGDWWSWLLLWAVSDKISTWKVQKHQSWIEGANCHYIRQFPGSKFCQRSSRFLNSTAIWFFWLELLEQMASFNLVQFPTKVETMWKFFSGLLTCSCQLVRQSSPYILEQTWEWTFLKVHNLVNKKKPASIISSTPLRPLSYMFCKL